MSASAAHVLSPGDIPVVQIDRGGQVTYHGPGQLVVYPMVDLRRAGLGVRDLVTALERSVLDYAAGLGVTVLRQDDRPEHQQERHDRHVDQEDRLPAERFGEDAADQHSHCPTAGGDRRPYRERTVPSRTFREDDGDQRQCRWGQQRRADSLSSAGSDQQAWVRC